MEKDFFFLSSSVLTGTITYGCATHTEGMWSASRNKWDLMTKTSAKHPKEKAGIVALMMTSSRP